MEILKSQLDTVLGSQFWVTLLEQGLGTMTSTGPFPLQLTCDSVKGVLCCG